MVQGKWNVTIKTPVGDKTGTLDLIVDGARLTGSLYDADHIAAINDGKIQGNKLTWSATITGPMRLNLKFTATVEADRIDGTARHLLGSAQFSGSRV